MGRALVEMARYSVWMLSLRRFIKAWGAHRLTVNRRLHGADDGDKARAHNYWSQAISQYERYLSRFPADIGVRIRLANTFRESGDLTAAIVVLREAVAKRPEKLDILLILADVLEEAGFSDDALQVLAQTQYTPNKKSEWRDLAEGGQNNPPAPEYKLRQVQIFVDVPNPAEESLFVTIQSLQNLGFKSWRAFFGGAGVNAEVLRELAGMDVRFAFSAESPSDHFPEPMLIIRAGTVLRRECLDWMLWALDDGVDAVYSDHEVNGTGKSVTVLQSSPHPLDLQTNPVPPAVVLLRKPVDTLGLNFLDIRKCLEQALQYGTVRHVPLVLACVQGAAITQAYVTQAYEEASYSPFSARNDQRILVIIPTRDEGDVLDVMLRSLFERASNDLIDVVVVDNGSCEAETFDVFDYWSSRGVDIIRIDGKFNWAYINNKAYQGRPHSIVVFANNDMEMLSDGWDCLVRNLLGLGGVGVVGARLLYPNGRVQHAGIVMGGMNGEPLHEGLRAARDERGPLDRWVRRRPATAVTGAFMAVRRSVLDALGGFDADNFAVSCNDVDFCLRAGDAGWTVLYAPEILLYHHESLSRGRSTTEAKRSRAAAEMDRLLERWSDYAHFDPNRNPQWAGRGVRLFAHKKTLTTQAVMDWAVKTEWRAADQIATPTFV